MSKGQRFEKIYSRLPKETGVNYLFHACGTAGGMTPLLDRDGKPIVSPIMNG